LKDEQKVFFLTVITILVVWIGDAAMDALVLHEGSFVTLLLNVRSHEPFLRIFLSLTYLVFGVLIARILAKRNQAELALKKHTAAIESSMDGIAMYGADLRFVYANQAFASINGYESPSEIINQKISLAYDETELARLAQIVEPALQKGGRWRGEVLAKRKNGSTYFQEASVTLLEDGGRLCIIRDISWRKRSEERLQRSERFLNTIFDSIRDPFCIFDRDYRVIRVNEAYAQMKSKPATALIGKKCFEVLAGRDTICDACVVDKTFHSADPCAKDKLVVLPNGTEAWIEIYTYPILDEAGLVSHVMEYTRDVTDRKKSEEERRRLINKLEHLSKTDVLTGLLNRRALTESLAYELDRARRYGSDLAIILFDIDNFKPINDTYGHDAGDKALQAVSETLKKLLRKADIAGRYGGDEFMMILPETSLAGAESLAEKIRGLIADTDLALEGQKVVKVSLSIGVSSLGPDVDNIDSLIKGADGAMYVSKQSGRNKVSTSIRPS